MFELPAALGALAEEVGHYGCCVARFSALRRFRDLTLRLGQVFQTAVDEHEAFGHGLFGRSQQAFVEPDGVRAGDFVEAVGDFGASNPPRSIFEASMPTPPLIGPVAKTSCIFCRRD